MNNQKQTIFKSENITEYAILNIHEKINARDHRNALNINWLYSTNLSDFKEGRSKKGDKETQTPRRKKTIFDK